MRIELLVGIRHYEHGNPFVERVDHAHALKVNLGRHDGGGVNFD